MNAMARGITLVAGCLALPLAAGAQSQPANLPPELKRIHVLLLIDTDSNLKGSVTIDKQRMLTTWERTVPKNRRVETVLEGKDATAANVLIHYQNLKVGKDEGLVFFYAGHGITNKVTKKHEFALSNTDLLPRDDVARAMKAKGAGLVVLLSDCCSTPMKVSAPESWMPVPESKGAILPTVRCLFFQSRGTVNVTAATDNASWGDDDNGGLFTRALCQLLYKPIDQLDVNKDRFVDWQEFFDKLKPQTENAYLNWSKHVLSRASKDRLTTDRELRTLADKRTRQVPVAFGPLPRRVASGYLMATIENTLDEPLRYEYRWLGKEWKSRTIPAGGTAFHYLPFTQGARGKATFEIREKGRKQAEAVDLEWWEGTTEPTPRDSKKSHPFPGKN